MTKQWKHTALIMSGVFTWAGVAGAAVAATPRDSAKSTTKTSASSALTDAQFAKSAAEGGTAEVRLGELAEDRGSNQAVKDLGQRMVTDHTKADGDLQTAASKDNITLPSQMNARDQAAYVRLSKLSGTEFDRAYTQDMVRDHEADIAAFTHEANDGKDATLKKFATQTLPTLEDHLKEARQTLQTVEPKTTATTRKAS
jgi:putative membrane protein